MDDAKRDRWWTMLAQAERFAATDNAVDALARVRRVTREVDQALGEADDGAERKALEQLLARAERMTRTYETLWKEWSDRVEARGHQYDEREASAYNSPLPRTPER